jgi:hypothetical protein
MLKSPPAITANGGDIVTSGAASASAIIPVRADGGTAKYVLVVAVTNAFIDFGGSAVAATATDSIFLAAGVPYIFNVAGCSHFAYLESAAAATIAVSPLENQ